MTRAKLINLKHDPDTFCKSAILVKKTKGTEHLIDHFKESRSILLLLGS